MAGNIFINYRRDETGHVAGRLHDRLAQKFGRDNLFMDVDHIPAGVDFVTHLNNQVAACDAILVLIGPNWLKVKDKAGKRRLYQPDDYVAIEIAAALRRDIPVIPVLVDGTRMPRERELPDALKLLARRQAVELRHAHFGKDAEVLLARIDEVLNRCPLVPDVSQRTVWQRTAGWTLAILSGLFVVLTIWFTFSFTFPIGNNKLGERPGTPVDTIQTIR